MKKVLLERENKDMGLENLFRHKYDYTKKLVVRIACPVSISDNERIIIIHKQIYLLG